MADIPHPLVLTAEKAVIRTNLVTIRADLNAMITTPPVTTADCSAAIGKLATHLLRCVNRLAQLS